MSKSKLVVDYQPATFDESYLKTVEGLWDQASKLMDYTTQPLSELYRLSSIVRMFAYNKNKLDNIRDQVADVKKSCDLAALRRLKKIVEYSQELKAWDKVWNKVQQEYDQLLADFGNQNQTGAEYQLLTATEILGEVYKTSQKFERKSFEREAEALALEIEL